MFISAMVLCACLVALTSTIMWVLVKNPKDHKIDANIVLLYSALTVPIATLAGAAYIKKEEAIANKPQQSITNPTPAKPAVPVVKKDDLPTED